ncbi:hypothetical protein G3545_09555 [Starkeya sp. ORNL1]|uniref:hypothetical protein n=1 Tax=Starkeya sp. ORNL1 TaxID=2709380 RepID=UPI0014631547|nr:hypothetical protein [Starkeya sp. ORNL1]QJP13875.1 hypothetical protein G3545_09555 [Starkeya sp. ORNL1]
MKRIAIGLAALMLAGTAALAAPSSTELFFDKPYLSSVAPGSKIIYAYKHVTTKPELGESFDEKLEMSVDAAPENAAGRVADVDILRGDKHSEAGPFPTMSGNPIALVLLERDVKEMATLSKGSPFYIRNRVRDALGNGAVEEVRFDYQGKTVDGWKITLTPFASDPNKDKLAELVGRRYVFMYSDQVPGGLYEVRVVTPKLDGSANIIETSLTLSGATVPAGK